MMFKNFTIVATGSQQLLSVEEVKNILRIEGNYDDARIEKNIRTAISALEDDIGFFVQPTTASAVYPLSQAVQIADYKVDSVVSVMSGSVSMSGYELAVTPAANSFLVFNTPQPSGEITVVHTTGTAPKNGIVNQALELLVTTRHEFTTVDKQSVGVIDKANEAYDRLVNKLQTRYL